MKQKIKSFLIIFQICLFTVNAQQKGCSSKVDQLQINLRDHLFEGEDLNYDLKEEYLKQSIRLQYREQLNSCDFCNQYQIGKSFSLQVNLIMDELFVFLDQSKTEESIFFQKDKIPTSDFKNMVKIAPVSNGLQCFDVEYIQNNKFIIDCQKEVIDNQITKKTDVFYLYSKQTKDITFFEDEAFIKLYNQRYIGLYYQKSELGNETTQIVRVTLSYSLKPKEKPYQNPILNDQTLLTNYLLDDVDSVILFRRSDLKFNIVDFKISYNGFIYLLDFLQGLVVVKLLQTGEWNLVHKFYEFERKEILFAFDHSQEEKLNYSEDGMIVFLQQNSFSVSYKIFYGTQQLPFIQLDYPSSIKISQDNIIVRNDKKAYFYKYDFENHRFYLNSQLNINSTDILLVNEFESDFILLNTINSYRYTFSNGYLYFPGSDKLQEKKVIVIKVKAPNNQQCVVSLTYQIIEDNESWIYRLDDQSMPFPKSIAEGQAQSIMKKQASGRNLQYKLTKPVQIGGTEITTSIRKRVELIQSPTQPKNVIFAQMISTQDGRIVYQFLQTEDLALQLLRCIYSPIYKDTNQCEVFVQNLDISSRLTRYNCQIWLSNYKFYLIFQVLVKTINLFTIQKQQNQILQTSNQILSIFQYMDYLLIHTANKDIFTFFIYRPELSVQATLKKNSFQQYDYEDWEPKAFFTNKKLNPNILFIQYKKNILILDSNFTLFSFINTIKITPKLDYSISIGKVTFFVVQGKSSNDAKDAQIYEYNFADIDHVYLQKKLYFCWYDISTPLNADFNEETGHLFVRGVCLYSSKSFFLVVKPNTPQHEALDRAWDIADALISDQKQILIASCGLHQTYLYLKVEGEEKLYALYNEAIMIVNSKIKQDIYSDFFSLNLQINNYNFQGKPEKFNTLNISQQVKIFSTLNKLHSIRMTSLFHNLVQKYYQFMIFKLLGWVTNGILDKLEILQLIVNNAKPIFNCKPPFIQSIKKPLKI
ncbi:unnamed protein product [Paramecium primaurelia]|uniref:Transmembrane protein n=1 Tax=Paramecium primaurelia TaxID=5886 RepID=A0A8S1K6I0_PARPR|nr:unnamed protein product [Paramecium primaurelia]